MKEKIELNYEALKLRRLFGEDAASPIDIFSLIASNDKITLVFYPFNENISGVCIKNDLVKLIAINSKMSEGRQRFTIAHELYHLYFQENVGQFVCGMKINEGKDTIENEANIFASYLLAPHDALMDFVTQNLKKQKGQLTLEDVVRIEERYGFSRDHALYRLLIDGYVSKNQFDEILERHKVSEFDTKLSSKSNINVNNNERFSTQGRYITLAIGLRQRGKISVGKYRELMWESFRTDLLDI